MNLGSMLSGVDPFEKLWHTVHDWHVNNDLWYYGEVILDIEHENFKDIYV